MRSIPRSPETGETADYLLQLCDRHPDEAHRWRPSREAAALMGIPYERLLPPEPLDELDMRRLVATAVAYPSFARAMGRAIGGAR